MRFGRLRACGAFLVSSQLDDGQVKTLCIESEKGQPCTVDNPWPRRRVRVHQKGKEGGWEIVVEAEGTQVRFAHSARWDLSLGTSTVALDSSSFPSLIGGLIKPMVVEGSQQIS